jgi:hypothetical protein
MMMLYMGNRNAVGLSFMSISHYLTAVVLAWVRAVVVPLPAATVKKEGNHGDCAYAGAGSYGDTGYCTARQTGS